MQPAKPRTQIQRQPGVVLASGSLSMDHLSLEDRSRLMSAVTEWIVNRSGISGKPKPMVLANRSIAPSSSRKTSQPQAPDAAAGKLGSFRRIDAKHTSAPQVASTTQPVHQPKPVSDLQRSVEHVRRSIQDLEARLQGQSPLSNPPVSDMNTPKVWRRWIAFDSVWETRSAVWRSKASRFGIAFNFANAFPSGQQVWTDIDLILNIVDQIIVAAIGLSRSGDRIQLDVRQETEDSHWLQIAVRTSFVDSHKLTQGKLSFATGASPVVSEAVSSSIQKRASLLGGYVDQVVSRDQGTTWKLHLPADDLLTWLERSLSDDLLEVAEVVLVSTEPQSQDILMSQAMDRAFQSVLGIGQRAIMITPRRYLVASMGRMQSIAAIERRYQHQMKKFCASEIERLQSYLIRVTELGSLSTIVSRIQQKLHSKHTWSATPPKVGKPIGSEQVHRQIHTSHAIRPQLGASLRQPLTESRHTVSKRNDILK
jgi:hypothetical protein